MKHSIKKQLALLFIALMAGLIFSCWLANNILFGKYYVQKKRQALVSAYDLVNAAGNENIMDTDDFQVTLQNTLAKGNMSILVLDQSYHTVISSVNESNILGTRLLENIYGSSSKDRETLESSDRYTLSRMRDGFLKNDYLELWGSLDNGDIFILRSPLGNNINEMAEKLEQAISELKTANNELQRDIEQKTKVDEMRKEFLSNVSHELKTPIALIQGYAEGLQECINDDAQSREFYCEVIMDEAGKMNRMVKKLLTLNQLEFGDQKVVMERFDIIALIDSILSASVLMAEQKGVTVRMDKMDPVYVWADEFDIEEVFTNYFSNALNHVDFEKVIEVKVRKEDTKVRVSVFNTGKQIPEEDIDRIWDKFYKVDKARTREYGGSGIGLSIVKAIMDALHQPFGVKNWDNGVEFWFELDGK